MNETTIYFIMKIYVIYIVLKKNVINSHKKIILYIFIFKTVEGCTIQNQIIAILKKR